MTNFDARLSKRIADAAHRSLVLRKAADICASHLIWFMAGGFGLVVYYLSGAVVDGFVRRLLSGVVLSWLVTLGLEYAFRRRRPFQEQGRRLAVEMLWVPPSFPSGHATLAFAMAAAVQALHDAALFGIALALACLVSLGRVAVRVHYVTDVLAGAAVGFGVASMVIGF
jgi:undecaprenyl-diphosphatase